MDHKTRTDAEWTGLSKQAQPQNGFPEQGQPWYQLPEQLQAHSIKMKSLNNDEWTTKVRIFSKWIYQQGHLCHETHKQGLIMMAQEITSKQGK